VTACLGQSPSAGSPSQLVIVAVARARPGQRCWGRHGPAPPPPPRPPGRFPASPRPAISTAPGGCQGRSPPPASGDASARATGGLPDRCRNLVLAPPLRSRQAASTRPRCASEAATSSQSCSASSPRWGRGDTGGRGGGHRGHPGLTDRAWPKTRTAPGRGSGGSTLATAPAAGTTRTVLVDADGGDGEADHRGRLGGPCDLLGREVHGEGECSRSAAGRPVAAGAVPDRRASRTALSLHPGQARRQWPTAPGVRRHSRQVPPPGAPVRLRRSCSARRSCPTSTCTMLDLHNGLIALAAAGAGAAPTADQAPLPRATRVSTCSVMRPLPLPNSTRVPSPPAAR
jgi:hypothetical protein